MLFYLGTSIWGTCFKGNLFRLFRRNSLKAQNVFKGQQIEIIGKLGTIDSNGKYISLESMDPYSFIIIQCYIKNDDQKAKIVDLSKGDKGHGKRQM